MTQYYRHPEGKKNAQLQKRLVQLCRLLKAPVEDAKVRAAAAVVREAYWRACRACCSPIDPDRVALLAAMEHTIHRVPLEWIIEGCAACVAVGKVPDFATAQTWFRLPGSTRGA